MQIKMQSKHTNEQLAEKIHNGEAEHITELYNNCYKLIYKYATACYNKYRERCSQCGAELADLISVSYFALLEAVKEYAKSDKTYKFTTFLRFPLLSAYSKLLNFGSRRAEPLDNYVSYDVPLPGTDDLYLRDTLEDKGIADTFTESENADYFKILLDEVEKLPPEFKSTIKRYYFKCESLPTIAKTENITCSAVQQRKQKALRSLRRNKLIRKVYGADYIHHYVSVSKFNATWTSSTELAVLMGGFGL